MTRDTRHNKILELISMYEIETQEDLVKSLRDLNFDVTQATISRDIKELGLIKILTEDKKYKYAVATNEQGLSDKIHDVLKSLIVSKVVACNLVCVKTFKGTAQFVASAIEKCGIGEILGVTYGDDTVLLIALSENDAHIVIDKLNSII